MKDENWREKNICHTCKKKDDCSEGKQRNYNYGSIVIKCTTYNEEL